MIAKGTQHNNGAKLAAYLTTGKENERADLFELRGFASDDIREAFRSVHVMADATRAEQPFFHVQVRTPDGENLTRGQWIRVADRIEAKLRLDGQPRAIAFHTNAETHHTHMHLAWSRIDPETMTARPLPFFKLRLKEVCRELEIEMGLTPVPSEKNAATMSPTRAEYEQARRLGIDIHEVRTAIRNCWELSDSGRSFEAALSESDLFLCRGDRRSFVVVDRAGGLHALGKRILGCPVAEVRTRLSDVDYQRLPAVEQTRMQLGCPRRSGIDDELARLSAIENRDAAAMLESLTRRRATFTAQDIDRTVGTEIEHGVERAEFVAEIMNHPGVVRVTGDYTAGRYTTNDVLRSEKRVLDDAAKLAASGGFDVTLNVRTNLLKRERYENISREQVRALRHTTGREGLALIDGQAGTGKSFTIGAIRDCYEAAGFKVLGLAPTNVVAQDMKEDGFSQARTIHSELYALEKGRTTWDDRSVIILDEAAMVGTKILGRVTEHARQRGAKLILVGDDRQLSSLEHGGLFPILKARHGAAELTQVRRQQDERDRRAAESMAKGDFRAALEGYAKKDAIHWAENPSEAAEALVAQWAQDHAANPACRRFVFAYTNQDVDELNRAIRGVREHRNELGRSTRFETAHGAADFAEGDRLQFTGTDKSRGIYNGQAGTVQRIKGDLVSVRLDGKSTRVVEFDANEFRDFRHGYSGTIYKGQGRTIDQTYLFHTDHWRANSSYVALTRHSQEATLFVARETAANLDELADQMSRRDDRRAASHFMPVSSDIHSQQRQPEPEAVDWRQYFRDPVYRRQFQRPREHRPYPGHGFGH